MVNVLHNLSNMKYKNSTSWYIKFIPCSANRIKVADLEKISISFSGSSL